MKQESSLTRSRHPRKSLRWWDIGILTAILFGQAIYHSTLGFLLSRSAGSFEGAADFSSADNYRALISQLTLLIIALAYLRLRRFDFSQWRVRITPRALLHSLLLFLAVALLMDLFFMATAMGREALAAAGLAAGSPLPASLFQLASDISLSGLPPAAAPLSALTAKLIAVPAMLPPIDLSIVLYALLNGVYEELYFLGICLAVPPKNLKWAFLFSLLIRFSFHTYQGLLPAAGISLILGSAYFFLYQKSGRSNLTPFFLSHAIADVFGIGILSYFL